jgi:uncharacterized protein DUF4113
MGYEKKWAMRQDHLSQRYTTRVTELLQVGAHIAFRKIGPAPDLSAHRAHRA